MNGIACGGVGRIFSSLSTRSVGYPYAWNRGWDSFSCYDTLFRGSLPAMLPGAPFRSARFKSTLPGRALGGLGFRILYLFPPAGLGELK